MHATELASCRYVHICIRTLECVMLQGSRRNTIIRSYTKTCLSLLEGAVLGAVQHGFNERPGPEFMALELVMCSASFILLQTNLHHGQYLLSHPTGSCELCSTRAHVLRWRCLGRLSLQLSCALRYEFSSASLSLQHKLSHIHRGHGTPHTSVPLGESEPCRELGGFLRLKRT